MGSHAADGPAIGLIANPASARDIRRIVANASNLQIADRVNIVLRLLASAGACGVKRVLMMPDRGGIRALLERSLMRERNLHHAFPEVEFLDMEPSSTVEDSHEAARRLRRSGVEAIVVLGGDGTHRAVVRECRDVPIAGISTGTNNAFPEMREPTLTGMAVGLYASGALGPGRALAFNKLLEIELNHGERRDIALVDAVVSSERCVGARALWKTENLVAAYLSFADPLAIGLSAIGGLLHPIGRHEPMGLALELGTPDRPAQVQLQAPIAPGLIRPVGIARWAPMPPGEPFIVSQAAGTLALDGERELPFEPGEHVSITLRDQAFPTVDVPRCLHIAAREGLFRRDDRSRQPSLFV